MRIGLISLGVIATLRVALLFSVLVLVACQPSDNDSSQHPLLQTETLQLFISPAAVPVETPLTMTLVAPADIVAVRGELQGVSMYMGRIPLQWRKAADTQSENGRVTTTQWHTTFLLGACRDPNMEWALQLWLEDARGARQMQQVRLHSSWR